MRVAHYILPWRPRWPGFIANTFFYAALLWLLIRAPFAFRRFLDVRVSFGVIVGVFGVIVIAAIVIAAVVYVRKRMQKP